MPACRIKNVHCGVTEDDLGVDETELRVSGTRYHSFRNNMNNGQDWPINFDVPFSTRCRIEVWDLDAGRWWDPHDRLGTHIVNAEQQGKGEQVATFNNYGARYEVSYEVV